VVDRWIASIRPSGALGERRLSSEDRSGRVEGIGYPADADFRPAPPQPPDPEPGYHPGYSSDSGRAPVRYPADPGYGRSEPGYSGDGRRGDDASRATESRYAALEPGYGMESGHANGSRYAALAGGYSPPVEPTWAEPARTEPVWGQPARAEPAWTDPARAEPAWAEPTRAEPAWMEPARIEPARVEPARIEPAPVESVWTEPARVQPAWAEPTRAEPVRVDAPPTASARVEWRASRPDAEVERAVSVLRRDLGRPRVLAFANPKGGVHKTTATVLAAAAIGSVRGRGVLAWDDNELRGTLGLRAGSARHARTIRHLVTDLALVESSHGTALTERMDDYLRHASDGSYDVLAGEESPRFAHRLDQHTVRRVLELLRRTHDVICVDTGNNVESANWQSVLQAADQLVVTTVPREDAAFTADWMLDVLHEIGMGELVENAVTLLSCATQDRSPLLDDLERHFATRTRAVAVVPYDPVLETGSSIEYGLLREETRQAWLRAASVMIEPFAR
jgi:MinD-like ATPase involved in chromosome partitioning or flagellar assembly